MYKSLWRTVRGLNRMKATLMVTAQKEPDKMKSRSHRPKTKDDGRACRRDKDPSLKDFSKDFSSVPSLRLYQLVDRKDFDLEGGDYRQREH